MAATIYVQTTLWLYGYLFTPPHPMLYAQDEGATQYISIPGGGVQKLMLHAPDIARRSLHHQSLCRHCTVDEIFYYLHSAFQ